VGVVDDALANHSNASVEKRDALAATMPDGTDFR
jgi:hypothetical protein